MSVEMVCIFILLFLVVGFEVGMEAYIFAFKCASRSFSESARMVQKTQISAYFTITAFGAVQSPSSAASFLYFRQSGKPICNSLLVYTRYIQ